MLRLFNVVPYVVVSPSTIESFLLLLCNCYFDTVINLNVNIGYIGYLICDHL